MRLATLNAMFAPRCRAALSHCCDCEAWTSFLAEGRPYNSTEALLERSALGLATMSKEELRRLVNSHPRISEARRDDTWSTREQSGVSTVDHALLTALAEGNRRYERKFGHVFLIRAAGRTGDELLRALQDRLSNCAATEESVVRSELIDLTRNRLEGLVRR